MRAYSQDLRERVLERWSAENARQTLQSGWLATELSMLSGTKSETSSMPSQPPSAETTSPRQDMYLFKPKML